MCGIDGLQEELEPRVSGMFRKSWSVLAWASRPDGQQTMLYNVDTNQRLE